MNKIPVTFNFSTHISSDIKDIYMRLQPYCIPRKGECITLGAENSVNGNGSLFTVEDVVWSYARFDVKKVMICLKQM